MCKCADVRGCLQKIKTVPIGVGDLVNLETFFADSNLIVSITPLMWQLKSLSKISESARTGQRADVSDR